MSATTSVALRRVDGVALAPPEPGGFVPAQAYVSQEIFELEMRALFPRSWVFVADTNDLTRPGDFVSAAVGYEPVVVVRGKDHEIRAFSNVCPHRAAVVAEGSGNCGARLQCPYHGWSFRLDGSLAAAPFADGFEGRYRPDELGLKPLRTGVWEQFVFVNVSGDAPPLLDWLEGAPAALAGHELRSAPRRYLLEDPVEANWKVLMDNGICGYHPTVVHASSLCRRPFHEPRGRSGRTTASVAITWSEPPEVVKPGVSGEAALGSVIFDIFPNFVVSGAPDGSLCAYWWRPVAVDRSIAGSSGYSTMADDPRMDDAFVHQIQEEDYAICRRVQAGLRSRFYTPGPQHELEYRVHCFQRWVMEMLASAP